MRCQPFEIALQLQMAAIRSLERQLTIEDGPITAFYRSPLTAPLGETRARMGMCGDRGVAFVAVARTPLAPPTAQAAGSTVPGPPTW